MKKNKKIIRIIMVILIAMWMFFVFSLSNQNATDSGSLSEKITRIFVKTDDEAIFEFAVAIVRKLAHLTEYAVGGFLFIILFLTFEFTENKKMIFSELVGVEYAIIDEVHQYFVDGRACQITDVCIDSIGVGLGICGFMLIYKIVLLIIERKKSDKKK